MLQTIKLLDVTITAETEEKILEYVVSSVHTSSRKLFITTPNPEILVYASTHPEYKVRLNTADIALPDGIGLLLGGYIMGKQLPERIAGVDFMEKLCLACREKPMSIGFLGGRGGVAELAAERLKKKYPWITVVWVGEEWGTSKNDALRYSNLEKPIDILFVAFGHPKQEKWIYENLDNLPVKAAMGVGGAFDYLSGKVVRAPKVVRLLGFEWLFRLIVQPWRWRRQMALFTFLLLLIKERFGRKGR